MHERCGVEKLILKVKVLTDLQQKDSEIHSGVLESHDSTPTSHDACRSVKNFIFYHFKFYNGCPVKLLNTSKNCGCTLKFTLQFMQFKNLMGNHQKYLVG